MNDLAAWIGKTGGAAWHNVQFTDSGAPTFTNTTNYPSSTPAKIQLAITCISCPIGSAVSFSCGTPLPDGTYINLPPTQVTKNTQIGFAVGYEIPAGWTSVMNEDAPGLQYSHSQRTPKRLMPSAEVVERNFRLSVMLTSTTVDVAAAAPCSTPT